MFGKGGVAGLMKQAQQMQENMVASGQDHRVIVLLKRAIIARDNRLADPDRVGFHVRQGLEAQAARLPLRRLRRVRRIKNQLALEKNVGTTTRTRAAA